MAVALLVAACGTPEPLLLIAGPDDLLSFELRMASGETLWKIESDEPRELSWLVYGVVPEGFRQIRPPAGTAPRELFPFESLETRVVSGTHVFTHYGAAEGTERFAMDGWKMEPRVESDNETTTGREAMADEDRR